MSDESKPGLRTQPAKTYCPECGGPSTQVTPIGAMFPKSVQTHTADCYLGLIEREKARREAS